MTLREQFGKEYNWVEKKEQPMFMSVKYIHWLEAKIEQLQNTSSNSDYAKLAKWVHDCVSFGGSVEQVEDYFRKNFA